MNSTTFAILLLLACIVVLGLVLLLFAWIKSRKGPAASEMKGDTLLQVLVAERRSLRARAAAIVSQQGLTALDGFSAYALARALAQSLMVAKPGRFQDVGWENLLGLLFCRSLLDPDEQVRQLLQTALRSADHDWVTGQLRKAEKSGFVALADLGFDHEKARLLGRVELGGSGLAGRLREFRGHVSGAAK